MSSSVLEANPEQKDQIEESLAFDVAIINAVAVDTHTEYVMTVSHNVSSWSIQRRYNDFRQLHQAIVSSSGSDVDFPGKKMTGNKDREFVALRQSALQTFMTFVTTHPVLRHSLVLKKFLNPTAYPNNLHDAFVQNVSMALRAFPQYEVQKPLMEIGWRASKQYFQVKNASDPKVERILAWSNAGPDFKLDQRALTSIQKSLGQMQHPTIFATELLLLNGHGCLSIRRFVAPQGSLRDLLTDSKPKNSFLRAAKGKGRPLDLAAIRSIGFQILSALKFLHDKNLAHGHLHAGNVFLTGNGVPYLSDLENYIMGLSSYHRSKIIRLKGPSSSAEAVDVYSFGHLLYEMSVGIPLHNLTCENALPNHLPDTLRILLESLLSIEATKVQNYPTLEELLGNSFFSNAIGSAPTVSDVKRHYLKFSSNAKEALNKQREAYEKRLQEDYKQFKVNEKERKRQDFLSDENRKKKKRQMKEQQTNVLDSTISIPSSESDPKKTEGQENKAAAPNPPPPPQGAPPPPPPPPTGAPPPPPPGPPPSAPSASSGAARTALLGSITSFSKNGLKKTVTVDKSKPRI